MSIFLETLIKKKYKYLVKTNNNNSETKKPINSMKIIIMYVLMKKNTNKN